MSSIYNIYERMRLYNGILANMEDTIERGESDAYNILNTYKEKLIKIVTLSGQMNDNESSVFRKMLEDGIDIAGTSLAHCYIDAMIKSHLIINSKRQLTEEDFAGFPNNRKEYSFACSSAQVYLDYAIGDSRGVNGLFYDAKDNKGKFIKRGKVKCIHLGNAFIFQYDSYFFIKIAGVHRLIINISKSGTSKNKIDLLHSVIK